VRTRSARSGREQSRGVAAEAGLILSDGAVRELDDLVLAKPGISRRHARLLEEDGRWFVEDCDSLYGTYLNAVRLPPRIRYSLRHADRIVIGDETLIFYARAQMDDPDDTARFQVGTLAAARELSPFQRQVVGALCAPWLAGGSLDELPSNDDIAAELGTPAASESVKAALRRAYAKAGLSEESSAGKRRKLCLVARRRGWI
jgi:predicted component of type VI protein secretion system